MDEQLKTEIMEYMKFRSKRLHEQGKISKEKMEQLHAEYDQGIFKGTMFVDTRDTLKLF